MDFMSHVPTDINIVPAQCSGPFRNDTSQHPEGIERVPVTVDSSNFRVACKRQYLLELLHTHVMVFP